MRKYQNKLVLLKMYLLLPWYHYEKESAKPAKINMYCIVLHMMYKTCLLKTLQKLSFQWNFEAEMLKYPVVIMFRECPDSEKIRDNIKLPGNIEAIIH